MFLLEVFFALTIVVILITIPFYISRVREFRSGKSQYSILILLIFMYTIFAFNFSTLTPGGIGESFNTILLSSFSQILLLFTVILFFKSFFLFDDIVLLKHPSRFKSRRGTILLGKVLKNDRKKHKFFLPLKDLERHMFVCGATGSGKSNFLQYFLTNFKKHYNIPFLLVEFKGEYTFLQEVIDDMLIIRPGENFSLNIFNPQGANPEIHAERLFNILKSGQISNEQYCVECHDNDRIWYPAHGSSENRYQNDYINMYYEMKEKFENKYLNKGKKISKK